MIFIGSDTTFNLTGLIDLNTGEYVNDAEVTGYLYDCSSDEVLQTFHYVYVEDSDGDYHGTLTAAMSEDCTPCHEYTVKIVAIADTATRTFSENHFADIGGYS